jgi:hypothetical protein
MAHLAFGSKLARELKYKDTNHSFRHSTTYARTPTSTEQNFALEDIGLEHSRRVSDRYHIGRGRHCVNGRQVRVVNSGSKHQRVSIYVEPRALAYIAGKQNAGGPRHSMND